MIEFPETRAVVTVTADGHSERLPRGHVRVVDGRAEWSRRRFNRNEITRTATCVEVREAGRKNHELVMDDQSVWYVALAGG